MKYYTTIQYTLFYSTQLVEQTSRIRPVLRVVSRELFEISLVRPVRFAVELVTHHWSDPFIVSSIRPPPLPDRSILVQGIVPIVGVRGGVACCYLLRIHAPRHAEVRPGRPTGIVREQVRDRSGHILGCAEPTEGVLGLDGRPDRGIRKEGRRHIGDD